MKDRKRVLIICQLDQYANGVRPVEIQRFLQRCGHEVRLVDTYFLSKTRSAAAFALLAVGVAWSFIINRSKFARHYLSYYVLVANLRLRRRILRSVARLDDFDLAICETALDAGALTLPTSARTLLDLPTPWADEMYLEGQMTKRQHRELRSFEIELYESVDYMAFHWETYARYAVEHYGISGRNLITLNWGCTPVAKRVEFSGPPRIVYLGSLWHESSIFPHLARLLEDVPAHRCLRRSTTRSSARLELSGLGPADGPPAVPARSHNLDGGRIASVRLFGQAPAVPGIWPSGSRSGARDATSTF